MIRDAQGILSDRVTTLVGFAELLLEGNYGPLTPQQKKVLFTIVTAGREVCDIVREAGVKPVED
mgnify:FL=1